MEIASALLKYPYVMNEQQRAIISHKQGPLLVVAGPGSGKTRSLTLLAINLLLCGDAEPSQIVLCTYTEKAAYELQDRLTSIARNVGYQGDLFQLRIGTIHSICQRIIDEHLHHTSLSHGYETLDQFTQQLLIFNQLEKICPKHTWSFLHDRWGTRWEVAKKLKFYFDIITEELLFEKLKENISQLRKHQTFVDTLLHHLTYAYDHYRQVLVDTNSTDFAHIQKWAHKLLTGPDTASHITKDIRYVLVDEYQDTNYIQEQILTLLASGTRPANFVAIGDEDQALYRFRGATVRNILTFAQTFPACKQIYLTTNYRSQIGIIDVCNHWIQRFDWSNSNGVPLRTEKSLRSDASSSPSPSVICLEAIDVYDEAGQIADFVATLKERGKIEDYSDIALLLYSVRPEKSDPYIQALEKRGISAYCPRARAFFQQREIKLLLGCFARVFLYPAEQRSPEITNEDFLNYIADCQRELMLCCRRYPSLERVLGRIAHEIEMILERDEAFNVEHLSRYFYQLLFEEPFFSFQKQEQKKANLVSFSNLIETFRQHYRQNASPGDRLNEIGTSFFERFFLFLQQEGLNEDQDQQQIFLQGHVQIMTIHQAKGLEFPVVVVGRLDNPPMLSPDKERLHLQSYFHHPLFEPVGRIPGCDRKRLYYVAFSRARNLLVLSAVRQPHPDFHSLWEGKVLWKSLRGKLNRLPEYKNLREYSPPKPRYGFTTHIQTYQTCPRRYHYFYEQRFIPSHQVDGLFGQLVHQTIERLHHQACEGTIDYANEESVRKVFDKTCKQLARQATRPLTSPEQEKALSQVLNYYQQNQSEMQHIWSAEFPVQVDHEQYILRGKVDLLLEGEKGLEVVDFKTYARPEKDSVNLAMYQQQLYFYAYALHKHTGRFPERLWLYWTAEEKKEHALMEVTCSEDTIKQSVASVDELILKIQNQQFEVRTPPRAEVCKLCDLRRLCKREGVIE